MSSKVILTGAYLLVALIASVLLALFTYLQPGDVQVPSIDTSWAFGLNYAFKHQLVMGKDIYFTFGPLGFLEHTAPISLVMLDASSNFWFTCSIISYFLILVLCRETARTRWHLVLHWALALILIFFANDHIQRMLVIAYTCVFLHWRTSNILYLLAMSMTTVLGFMIKFSYGAALFALYIPYLLFVFLRDKQWRHLLFGALTLPVFYLLIWYYLYHETTGAIEYLKGGLEFSQGSISAMALNPPNHWLAITGFYLAFCCGVFITAHDYRKAWILMPFCFLGPLFIWSKYSFGREESWHLTYLISYVFYLGLIWLIAIEALSRKIACMVTIFLCFFCYKFMALTATQNTLFLPRLVYFAPETFPYRWKKDRVELIKLIRAESSKVLAPVLLDQELLDVIDKGTVDIYPWETVIAEANKLKWVPRPIFQSYISYTPFLDQKNLDFYNSEKAPDFIIWHYHSFQDIDNRYVFSSDPLTLQGILQHYHPVLCKGFFCVWRHEQKNQLSIHVSAAVTETAWNTWIPVPPSTGADVIRAHIQAKRTLRGRLNMAIWKEGGIEVDYRLKNGAIKTHTAVLDNAISGLWVSPYLADGITNHHLEVTHKAQFEDILRSQPAEGYIENAEPVAQGLHVAGWGFVPTKTSQTQRMRLLFTNDDHAYIVTLQNHIRNGMSEHFGTVGVVDLNTCGIDETIDTHQMVTGKYRLTLIIDNEGETRVLEQKPPVEIEITNPTGLADNVEAIRLRTTRPWAFQPTFQLHWSDMTFVDGKPW
jgi:hypothetical protein